MQKEKSKNKAVAKKTLATKKDSYKIKEHNDSHYFHEMGKYKLLTEEQEKELSKKIQEARIIKEKNEKTLTSKEKEVLEMGKQARELLINSNLRLVIAEAKKLSRKARVLELDDLIQEGNKGLLKAVEKYDYKKGFRFSTYAIWWIQQAITRSIAEKDRMIRVPVYVFDMINKVFKTANELSRRLGRTATDVEIARELNITVKEYNQLKERTINIASLDSPVSSDSKLTLGETIADDTTEKKDSKIEEFKKKEIIELFEVLDEREKTILSYRLGLNKKNEIKTLDEIGKMIHYTRERVRQFEKIAIKKLYDEAKKRKLDIYLGLE